MKKVIIVLFLIVIILVIINHRYNLLLPRETIRFRIIANSDSTVDQKVKLNIKNEVVKELNKLINKEDDYEKAKLIIENNIDKIHSILDKYNIDYSINFGNNYFPKKEYKGIKYDAGNYESLVITLGEGSGKNWWCVLFPPLCLLDENLDDYEYQFYFNRVINKYR